MKTTKYLKVSDKVCYQPKHYKKNGEVENGIVKEVVSENSVRVVYKCNNDWANYKDYTGALTDIQDLSLEWIT